MRVLLLVVALVLSGWTQAERLIMAPTAKKVPFGTARLEYLFDQAERDWHRTSLAVGVTTSIDAELTYENIEGHDRVLSYDVSYNILPPLTNLAPGFSVGLRDGTGKTKDGRFVYAASTFRFGQLGQFNGDSPAEATLGFAIGDRTTPFVGVVLPFRESFRLLAEFDTRRTSGGLEFRPHRDVWVRWIHREKQSLWSLTLVSRW